MKKQKKSIKTYTTQFTTKFVILEVTLFVLMSLWYIHNFYESYSTNIKKNLSNSVEAVQINIVDNFHYSHEILTYIGKLIVQIETKHEKKIFNFLDVLYNHFKTKELLVWSPVLWSDNALNITIDSNFGVLDPPYQSIAASPFIPDVITKPWQLLIGTPKKENTMGIEIIPFALGITDKSKQYIGAIISAFELSQLEQKLNLIQQLYGDISLGIVDSKGKVVISSKGANYPKKLDSLIESNLLNKERDEYLNVCVDSLSCNSKSLYIKKASKLNGYYIFAAMDGRIVVNIFFQALKDTFFNLIIIASLCIIIFLFTRKIIISPIIELSHIAGKLKEDERDIEIKDYNTAELNLLAEGMRRIITQKTELLAANDKLEFLLTQLEAMNKTKLDFIRNIQHELRTPLNHIIGGCEVMNSQFSGPINQEYLEYIEIIYQSGKDLLNKINNIITIADFEAGSVKLEEGKYNLEQIIDTSIQSLLPKIKQYQLKLSSDIQKKLPEVYIDAEKMKTVLINVLNNSISFNKPKGSISVTVLRSVAGILIEISDTGYGIKNHDLNLITEMFSTSGDILTKVKSGLGLGLTIAQCILDLHDIKMEISSEIDEGTTIKILIPNIRLIKD